MVDVAPWYVVVSIHICLKAYFDFIVCGNDDDGDVGDDGDDEL